MYLLNISERFISMYNREREDHMNRTTTVIQIQLTLIGIDKKKKIKKKDLNI